MTAEDDTITVSVTRYGKTATSTPVPKETLDDLEVIYLIAQELVDEITADSKEK